MNTEDLVGICIVGVFFGLMTLEAWRPARSYPPRRAWRARGVLLLVVMAGIATAVPLLLPLDWLAAHRLVDGTKLGTVGGVFVGYGVVSFVSYLWHRACHRFDFLWRGFHQLHHAPARLDLAGAVLFHPLDIGMYVLLSTVTTTLVLGLTPAAAALTGLVAQLYSFFQHLNVKTPRFFGYFIQRPEAHFLHHERGVHARNYADLPLWDMLFSSYQNPESFGEGPVGFDPPAEGRYGAMLCFVDVSDKVGVARGEPKGAKRRGVDFA
jgi:sterol desaturase/sphingolipid hydroxylase (fatty acid hydroxylase superfamily)